MHELEKIVKIGICYHSTKLIYSTMLKIIYIFTSLFTAESSPFLSAMKQLPRENSKIVQNWKLFWKHFFVRFESVKNFPRQKMVRVVSGFFEFKSEYVLGLSSNKQPVSIVFQQNLSKMPIALKHSWTTFSLLNPFCNKLKL